jgi:hypothetical protein
MFLSMSACEIREPLAPEQCEIHGKSAGRSNPRLAPLQLASR